MSGYVGVEWLTVEIGDLVDSLIAKKYKMDDISKGVANTF
jgi:hypothetical protein